MLNVLFWLGIILGVVIGLIVTIIVVLNFIFIVLQNEKYSDDTRFKFVSWIVSWASPLFTNAKVDIEGLDYINEVETGVIYANHQSIFDIFATVEVIKRKHGYIAKEEIGSVFLLNRGMRLIRCEFLPREDNRAAVKVILEAIKTVKMGHIMVIFPEGTRGINAPMGTFKAGSFKVATKAKADIIPMTIYNSYEVNKRWPLSTTVRIKVHKPIPYAEYEPFSTHEIAEKVEKIVKSDLLGKDITES